MFGTEEPGSCVFGLLLDEISLGNSLGIIWLAKRTQLQKACVKLCMGRWIKEGTFECFWIKIVQRS